MDNLSKITGVQMGKIPVVDEAHPRGRSAVQVCIDDWSRERAACNANAKTLDEIERCSTVR